MNTPLDSLTLITQRYGNNIIYLRLCSYNQKFIINLNVCVQSQFPLFNAVCQSNVHPQIIRLVILKTAFKIIGFNVDFD